MEISASTLVGIFDRIGLVAFAFSGVQAGLSRRLDIFGLLVLGVVTATGGGVMRDVVLGRLPRALDEPDYLLFALAGSIVAVAAIWTRRSLRPAVALVAEAVGLGAFASAGALAAIHAELALPAAILLAILTAVGGGVIRDVLVDRVPLVLLSEVNATASAVGGLVVWAVEPKAAGLAGLLGAAATAGVLVISRRFRLNLPVPGGRGTT